MAPDLPEITVMGRDRIDLFKIKPDKCYLHGLKGGPMLLCQFLREESGELNLEPKFRDVNNNNQRSRGQKKKKRVAKPLFSIIDLSPVDGKYRAEPQQSFDTIYPRPDISISISHGTRPENNPLEAENPSAFLVIDDPGGELLSPQTNWAGLEQFAPSVVFYHTRNLKHADETPHLFRRFDNDNLTNLVIVIDAADLRDKGITISRNASWEKTAIDTVKLFKPNRILKNSKTTIHWIIRFSYVGAIVLQDGLVTRNQLYFDPKKGEGDVIRPRSIPRPTLEAAFMSGLIFSMMTKSTQITQINEQTVPDLMPAIKKGLYNVFYLASTGFPVPQNPENWALQYPKLEPRTEKAPDLRCCTIPPSGLGEWSILKQHLEPDKKAGQTLEDNMFKFATRIVNEGTTITLKDVPIVKFGKIIAADRWRIENFHEISNEVEEYLEKPEQKKPLSIGVFGAPGSGKSFGIKQIIRKVAHQRVDTKSDKKYVKKHGENTGGSFGVDPARESDEELDNESDEKFEKYPDVYYNLSQFLDYSHLLAAFQKARDKIVSGQIPIVYFDEFDTTLNGELGWLKYFLAPMEDGNFFDHGDIRPIGKAIFIFIGGTAHTYEAFQKDIVQILPGGSASDLSIVTRQQKSVEAKQQGLEAQQKKIQAQESMLQAKQKVADAEKTQKIRSMDKTEENRKNTRLAEAKQYEAQAKQEMAKADQQMARAENQFPGQLQLNLRRDSAISGITQEVSFDTALQKVETTREWKAAKTVKKPDFVSRLRKHLDIPGYDKPDKPAHEEDFIYMVRRAIIIRSKVKAKKLSGVDDQVLNGLLKVEKYEHGARSIEAILNGGIEKTSKLHRGALSDEVLRQHLNLEKFNELVDDYS